jgi:hypothetical protein
MHAYNEVECGSRRCVWSTIQAHEAWDEKQSVGK